MFKSRFCILLWQCSCWKRCKNVFERGLICWASCRGCRHKCVWEAQAVRSQKDYLQISYPGLTFPKKSLLAFFLVFLTAAHRVTLSDCLQRPADGLRKSRQHFILIFGEGEIVLFEEETLVGGRKVQLGGARGQSACTARRLTPTFPKDDLLLGILTFTRPRICRIARLSLDTKQSNQGKTSMTGFWMTRPWPSQGSSASRGWIEE